MSETRRPKRHLTARLGGPADTALARLCEGGLTANDAIEGALYLAASPPGDDDTMAILGLGGRTDPFPSGWEASRQALAVWAGVVERASAEIAGQVTPADWCLLADVLNGTIIDAEWSRPGMMIAANVEDAHRLDGVGAKWYGDDADGNVRSLLAWLHGLSDVQGWAVVYAVRWFWQHSQDQFATTDPWWTPAFRRAWLRDKGR